MPPTKARPKELPGEIGANLHQASAQNAGDIGALIDRLDAPSRASPARRRPAATASAAELRVGILLWPQFPLLSLAGLCDGLVQICANLSRKLFGTGFGGGHGVFPVCRIRSI